MEIISVKNLNVSYQNTKILNNISFSIDKGDYIGIVGPNGAGKTTLIKSLLGLNECTYDEMKINSTKIGYLQQKYSAHDNKFPANVYEIIKTGLISNKKFPRIYNKSDKLKVDDIIKLLGITDLKDKLIGKLSGGQLQKVMLARALVNDIEILFLDEPTTALDPGARDNFYDLISKVNKEKSVTVLLVTHDLGSIGMYADKLLYIDYEIIFYGNFKKYCESNEMTDYFGIVSQHIFCQRH